MPSNPLLRLGKYIFFPTSFVLYYDTYGFFKSIKVEMFFTEVKSFLGRIIANECLMKAAAFFMQFIMSCGIIHPKGERL